MEFKDFVEIYKTDMQSRVRYNTWLTKEHIINTKILPFFANKKLNEIRTSDVIQWQNEIMKMKSITDGKELSGCKMKVTDKETGAIMDEWISTEFSHVIEGKYVVGKTYILSESKPADGFVTATDVEFTVLDDGKIQKVSMVDDTTKIEFNKLASDTKKQLKGAKYKVYDSKGKKVYEFTTGNKAELIEGVLKVGETYTFKECAAPEHYRVAEPKTITIKDTGKIQKLTVVDARIPEVPDTPQTGITWNATKNVISIVSLILALMCLACVRAKDKSKYKFTSEDEENEEE